MALIKCPECGQEVSNLAPACIHCGYPLNEEQPVAAQQSTTIQKPAITKKPITKKQKLIAVVCVVAVIIIACFSLFHLGEDEQYAYDLMISNAHSFKNPKGAEVLSGCAGYMEDEDEAYAFLRISASNSYGASVSGYYCLHPDYATDVSSDDYMVKLCNDKDLNVGNINRRLALYWFFR